MTVCNGYPEVTVVPPVGSCCTNSAIYAINKLPGTYPQVLSMESLQEAYGYTVNDFNLPASSWYVYSYAISGEYSTQAESVESTCSAAPVDAENDGLYYSYLPTVKKLQGGRDWVVSPLTCEEPSNGITKGPATLILADMSILPSPTVTPALKVRVNNPWYNVLRASANNILYANPPKGTCKSGKWKLVYSQPGAFPKIEWECEGDDEDGRSSFSWSSGSTKVDCKDLHIDIKLVVLDTKNELISATVTRLQDLENLCYLQVTTWWTGSTEFPGDNLMLYVSTKSGNDICPRVFAGFGDNFAAPQKMWWPLQAFGAAPPIRKGEVRMQKVHLFALPCEDPRTQEDYAPCCEDNEDNGVGDTTVEFLAVAERCGIQAKTTLKVSCDKNEDEGPDPQFTGRLEASVFFRDASETITNLNLSTCGQKLTGSATVYLCANVRVVDGDYCSCYNSNDRDYIKLSGVGVDAQTEDVEFFSIPKGIHKENDVIPFSAPVAISGKGSVCSGKVTATVFNESVTLTINNNCKCDDSGDTGDFILRGDDYIGVKGPEPDEATGKPVYRIFLKNYERCETAQATQQAADDETQQ